MAARAGRPGGRSARRVRGPAAHRAADRAAACKTLSVCYLSCRVMATAHGMPSRALPPSRTSEGARQWDRTTEHAKPRTAVARRHGQWRGGASREARRPSIAPLPPSRTGEGARQRDRTTGHGRGARAGRGKGARDAKPRTAPMARRRDGDIAPYRQAARGMARYKNRTAKPHERCAR